MRHQAVRFFVDENAAREDMREQLKNLPDMMRALSRLVLARGDRATCRRSGQPQGGGRCARSSVQNDAGLPEISAMVRHSPVSLGETPASTTVVETLATALGDTLPVLARDGGFVRDGYHPRWSAREKAAKAAA